MARFNEEHIEFIKNKFNEGLTYKEINNLLYKEYDVLLSDDAVRYHCTTKDRKIARIVLDKKGKIKKKLIISDLHIPYHRKDIMDIINRHKHEIDEIIFNGDIMDCGEISSFDDLGKYSLVEEMEATHGLLEEIDEATPSIKKVLVIGNHEMRWRRYMAKMKTAYLTLHGDNILKEVCDGFEVNDYKREIVATYKPLSNYTVINSWWYVVNDLIACHPISFSKVKAKTVTMAIDYFIKQRVKFKAIVVAHTHDRSIVHHYDKYGCEQGCLCKPMSYSTSGKLGYAPQAYGYYLAVFVDDEFDENRSRSYKLEEE